jgi:hypothetical protein
VPLLDDELAMPPVPLLDDELAMPPVPLLDDELAMPPVPLLEAALLLEETPPEPLDDDTEDVPMPPLPDEDPVVFVFSPVPPQAAPARTRVRTAIAGERRDHIMLEPPFGEGPRRRPSGGKHQP